MTLRIDSPRRYQEPEFLPWDGRRVPITFIGGYLGAGKTTLINELLAAADRPIAVVVNDVGTVNIDARLIRRRTGDIIELTDGCVCCSSIDGMGAALDAIRSRPVAPDHVVVELSGVADPQRMVPWGRSAGFRLDGVVVVVAADQLTGSSLPPTVSMNIRTHIASADLLILTKTDLVDLACRSHARAVLAKLAPGIAIVESEAGRLLPGALGRLVALGTRRPGGAAAIHGPSMFDLHEVTSVVPPVGMTAAELRSWLVAMIRNETGRLVRAKGVVETSDHGLVLVQVVGPRIELEPLPLPELQDPTELVVIRLAHLFDEVQSCPHVGVE